MNSKVLWIFGAVLAVVIVLGCIGLGQKETAGTENNSLSVQNQTKTQVVTQVQAAEIKPVTARTWYPIAKTRALEWNSEAKIVSIIGDNTNGTSFLAADGSSLKWKYTFVSVPLLKRIELVVENGKITSENVLVESLAKMQYEKAPGEVGFIIDSNKAFDVADGASDVSDYKSNFKPHKITYLFNQDGLNTEHPSIWSVSYFPTLSTSTLVEYVDATNGKLI